MALAAAYPGVRAVFTDTVGNDPDLQFNVVVWLEKNGSAVGLIVVPDHTELYQPAHAPVASNYDFAGYAYCS